MNPTLPYSCSMTADASSCANEDQKEVHNFAHHADDIGLRTITKKKDTYRLRFLRSPCLFFTDLSISLALIQPVFLERRVPIAPFPCSEFTSPAPLIDQYRLS
ncbi:hypothetical protein M514_07956 [Trichuris suis]|uniref:Uncharacterized protein n=1 Tax=Trichuris suis TaxID=68888 RepID=A0A085M1U6_9BILA|nr:hypothetical protein M513_07956 [Trichuris suis]KFD69406.1 hypothetical protein M514_07956 [Trichuris suis]